MPSLSAFDVEDLEEGEPVEVLTAAATLRDSVQPVPFRPSSASAAGLVGGHTVSIGVVPDGFILECTCPAGPEGCAHTLALAYSAVPSHVPKALRATVPTTSPREPAGTGPSPIVKVLAWPGEPAPLPAAPAQEAGSTGTLDSSPQPAVQLTRRLPPLADPCATFPGLDGPRDVEALYRWGRELGLESLLSERAYAVQPITQARLHLSSYRSVAEVLATRRPDGTLAEAQRRLAPWILAKARQAHAARAAWADAVAALTPPQEPALALLWNAAFGALASYPAPQVPVGQASANAQITVHELPSRAVVTLRECRECEASRRPGWQGTLTLGLEGEGILSRCLGYSYFSGTTGCPHTGRAALAVLEVLSSDTPARAALAAELAQPAWQRALGRIAGATSTRYVLQLRPEEHRILGQVALATPKKRGDGFTLKRCTTVPNDAPRHAKAWARVAAQYVNGALADIIADAAARDALFVVGSDRPWPVARETARLTTRRAKLGDRYGHGLALSWGAEECLPLPKVEPHIRMSGSHVVLGDGVVQVIDLPDALGAIFASGVESLVVPRDGLAHLVRHMVQAEVPLALPEGLSGKALPSDAVAVLRLEWRRPTLTLTLGLHLHADYPVLRPCEAPEVLYVTPEGGEQLAHLTRDFAGERRLVESLAERLALPPDELATGTPVGLDQLAHVMATVRALGDAGEARLEWQSAAPRVAVARPDQVSVNISPSGRDWFGVDGIVNIEGGVPLALVLAAIRDRQSYVALGDDHFVLLSDALTEALTPLAGTAEPPSRKGGRWRVGRVGAAAIAAADTGVGFDAPNTWVDLAQRVREAAQYEPQPPPGLRAELRPYQRDGVRWLLRLERWAPGALLADDMGLGKTVQAIALLVARGARGPALVVAPTSVGFNWVRELERFAPALRPRVFRGVTTAAALEGLGPQDVVVTSYDLVAGYLDRFDATEWSTVVFDEAQAIKNPTTQRAQAAAALRADFRVALSGTPIENRPEELWSLFNATVPGLLGGLESFRERFGAAGQAHGSRHARLLSRVIRPFVLRRLKREVAQDLPARTEINVEVVLSADERALYDKIRAAALRELSAGEASPQRRFQVLAAITRLRQAACHPRLLDAASQMPSSKLAALLERVDELRAEGHRALIFSQFTAHLGLVREALDDRAIAYRYLDGATPATQRRREVDAFQAGEGDVFLLSLKAGGTGLNLTGADYVIHLDPWWNPAVEDQATDRAHRIGQTRPVTVYRLVAKDTLEEKILALHADKRELVASVLDGTGEAAALSVDELMALLDPLAGLPASESEVVDASAPVVPSRPNGAGKQAGGKKAPKRAG